MDLLVMLRLLKQWERDHLLSQRVEKSSHLRLHKRLRQLMVSLPVALLLRTNRLLLILSTLHRMKMTTSHLKILLIPRMIPQTQTQFLTHSLIQISKVLCWVRHHLPNRLS